jgi:hypothetical protein
MVEGRVKYLVQVQCQPTAGEHEEYILRSLRDSFNVTGWHCAGADLTMEIRSDHPLAYGVFKDLAELVKQTLAQRNLRLRSGAVYRVERHPLSALAEALGPGSFDSLAGAGKGPAGLWQRLAEGLLGGPRLTPEMFFYGEVSLDLVLSAKARRLAARRAAPEAN